jgi:hypothetical protein
MERDHFFLFSKLWFGYFAPVRIPDFPAKEFTHAAFHKK